MFSHPPASGFAGEAGEFGLKGFFQGLGVEVGAVLGFEAVVEAFGGGQALAGAGEEGIAELRVGAQLSPEGAAGFGVGHAVEMQPPVRGGIGRPRLEHAPANAGLRQEHGLYFIRREPVRADYGPDAALRDAPRELRGEFPAEPELVVEKIEPGAMDASVSVTMQRPLQVREPR